MNYLTHWYLTAIHSPDVIWNVVGFLGTGLFGLRFVVQWLKSEQEGHSVIPIAFWYFSLLGGTVSFVYVVHLRSWPLMLGQGVPLLIYARNLSLVYRDRARRAA
jgi:lipid-A-disaccharide synthase-like uncharacterized protein